MSDDPVTAIRKTTRLGVGQRWSRRGATVFAIGSLVPAYYAAVAILDALHMRGAAASARALMPSLGILGIAVLNTLFFAWAALTGYRWEFDGEIPAAPPNER